VLDGRLVLRHKLLDEKETVLVAYDLSQAVRGPREASGHDTAVMARPDG